jgi:hypothetical protein
MKLGAAQFLLYVDGLEKQRLTFHVHIQAAPYVYRVTIYISRSMHQHWFAIDQTECKDSRLGESGCDAVTCDADGL